MVFLDILYLGYKDSGKGLLNNVVAGLSQVLIDRKINIITCDGIYIVTGLDNLTRIINVNRLRALCSLKHVLHSLLYA